MGRKGELHRLFSYSSFPSTSSLSLTKAEIVTTSFSATSNSLAPSDFTDWFQLNSCFVAVNSVELCFSRNFSKVLLAEVNHCFEELRDN